MVDKEIACACGVCARTLHIFGPTEYSAYIGLTIDNKESPALAVLLKVDGLSQLLYLIKDAITELVEPKSDSED